MVVFCKFCWHGWERWISVCFLGWNHELFLRGFMICRSGNPDSWFPFDSSRARKVDSTWVKRKRVTIHVLITIGLLRLGFLIYILFIFLLVAMQGTLGNIRASEQQQQLEQRWIKPYYLLGWDMQIPLWSYLHKPLTILISVCDVIFISAERETSMAAVLNPSPGDSTPASSTHQCPTLPF